MLPDREGRFRATIKDCGVSRMGKNQLLTFVCEFHLVAELSGDEWIPVDQGYEITGYFYLVKRDGNLNTITIESLTDAFGWDGRDPMWLQDADFSHHQVQLKLEWETYEGKTRMRIKYLNNVDATPGGIVHADDTERRAIVTMYGPKFRAQAGGTPVATPMPVAVQPPTPTAPPVTAAPPAATATPVATTTPTPDRNSAWAALLESTPGQTQAQQESHWFEALARQFPNRDEATLTAAEWLEFTVELPKLVVPF